jgi:flagellar assembly protein FliH
VSSHVLTGDATRAAKPFNWIVSHSTLDSSERVGTAELDTAAVDQRVQSAFEQGRREGHAAAQQAAAARVEAAVNSLAAAVEQLSGMRARLRGEAEEDIVKLGIAIARRVLNREIHVDGEAMLGIVKAALQRLDARELHRVRLHPQHADAVTQALAAMSLPRRVEVLADGTLELGAAVFETVRGSLDASVETQLKEIERGFVDLVHTRR